MKDELERRHTNTDLVVLLFRAYPGKWISTQELERVGGRQAWRSRTSDARKIFRKTGGNIENRQTRTKHGVISEYRYVPHEPIGPSADVPRETRLF
jgi:hypothetical protein